MTSNRVFMILRRALVIAAVAFAMVIAMLFAANNDGVGHASFTMSAVNLSMFDSFTSFKQWLASVPYYYYVFIGLGLLVLAIITTSIAIFKRGRIKRNNVNVLMMVGDSDEEVDATIFKEHFAVVVIAKPTNMLPVSDKVIEPLFPMDNDVKYSSSPSEIPVAVEHNVIVGDEGLDENLVGSYRTLSDNIADEPSVYDETMFKTSKMMRGTAAREQVLLNNDNEEELVLNEVEQNVAQSITQAPNTVTTSQEDNTSSSDEFESYDEPAASIIDNDSEPLFVDGGYNIYDDEVPAADMDDDFGFMPLVSDTDFDEEVESHYKSDPTTYTDTVQSDRDINVMPIIIASADASVESEVVHNQTTAPIALVVANQSEFECIEIEDDAPQIAQPLYNPDTTFDYEIFDNNSNVIGEQDNEVLFDIVDEYSNVATATISYSDNEVEEYGQLEPATPCDTDEQITEDVVNETADDTFNNIDGMGVDDAVLMVKPQKKKDINTEDNAYTLLNIQDATEDAVGSNNNGTIIADGDGDGVVDEVLVDKDILKVRYKTVDLDKRLRRANEDTKAFYSELKNCLLSHGGVKSRLSKKFDTFTVGRFITAKIAIRGNIINLYLALPGERVDEKYFAENVGDSETYGKTPTLHKVKSRRGCKYGLDLIVELMTDLNLSVVDGYENIDYVAMYPAENIEEKKAEIAHLFRSSISVDELEDMTDEEAIDYIDIVKSTEYTINKFNPINKYVIFLDDIASLYESGDTVTIADLIEKVAIPDESNIYLEVRGRGVLDKKLFIEAHSYDLQAVKMIILTDGYVTQYK